MRELWIELKGGKWYAYTIKDGVKSKELEINKIVMDDVIMADLIVNYLPKEKIEVLIENLKKLI